MRSSSSHLRAKRLWAWALAFAPAFVLLAIMLPLRGLVPFRDSWRFVGQYQDWLEGHYTWQAFLAHHYAHPAAVGKLIYFAVLHWLHGEVAVLPVLSWIFSAFIAFGACLLSRPLWSGSPLRTAVLISVANLTVFTTAQADAWVWDFLFQNFIPGVCLVAGLCLLSKRRLGWGRIALAAALTVIAAFSLGSGFLVGILFFIPLWHGTAQMSLGRRCLWVGAWLVFAGIVAWGALGSADLENRQLGSLFEVDRWSMRLQFLLVLLGRIFGEGTVFEPHQLATLVGGTLVALFLACVAFLLRHRRNRELIAAALPWIACSLYGLGSASLICVGRMQRTFDPALADRYVSLTLFFTLGSFFLLATLLRFGEPSSWFVRVLRRGWLPALPVLYAAHFLNWEQGYQTMRLWHVLMEQERAMLAFIRVLPPDPEWMQQRQTRPSTFRLASDLLVQGRLRHVKVVVANQVSVFHQGRPIPSPWAGLDTPVALGDGRWRLEGRGGLSDTNVADLVLITAAPPGGREQIVALAAPLLADTYWERRKQRRLYPEHFFGWSCTLSFASLPRGQLNLRAYAFDQDEQTVRPMEGIHSITIPPESP